MIYVLYMGFVESASQVSLHSVMLSLAYCFPSQTDADILNSWCAQPWA